MSNLVDQRWGEGEFTRKLESAFWMNSPIVQGILNRRVTDEPSVDWLSWVLGTCFEERPHGRCLVLGCGHGWLERAVAASGVFDEIEAQDVSPSAVNKARGLAEEAGFEIGYSVSDLNESTLPAEHYDAIFAHSVIHHVDNIEHLLRQVRRALTPGGLLVVNEYVGPNFLQYTPRQIGMVNSLLGCLPPELRTSLLSGEVLDRRIVPDADELRAEDPSESVRSSEIPTLLEREFEVLDHRNVGGTLLSPLLYEILPCFDHRSSRDTACIGIVAALEETLYELDLLGSDYQFWILQDPDRGQSFTRRTLPARPVSGLGLEDIVPVQLAPPLAGAASDLREAGRSEAERSTRPILHFVEALTASVAPWHLLELPTGWTQATLGGTDATHSLPRLLDPWLTGLDDPTVTGLLSKSLDLLREAART